MIWELSAGLARLFKCVFKSNPLLLEDETNQTTGKEHHQAHALLVRLGDLLKTALQEFAFCLILSLKKVVETDVIYFLLMPFGLSGNLCIFLNR